MSALQESPLTEDGQRSLGLRVLQGVSLVEDRDVPDSLQALAERSDLLAADLLVARDDEDPSTRRRDLVGSCLWDDDLPVVCQPLGRLVLPVEGQVGGSHHEDSFGDVSKFVDEAE